MVYIPVWHSGPCPRLRLRTIGPTWRSRLWASLVYRLQRLQDLDRGIRAETEIAGSRRASLKTILHFVLEEIEIHHSLLWKGWAILLLLEWKASATAMLAGLSSNFEQATTGDCSFEQKMKTIYYHAPAMNGMKHMTPDRMEGHNTLSQRANNISKNLLSIAN